MAAETQSSKPIVVGVLSDTHGQLYAAVKESLEGVDHIIHAGDIGSQQVLAALRALGPVTAVRGNCDFEAWASSLPGETEVELGGVRILVRHFARSLAKRRPDTSGITPVTTADTDAPGSITRVVISGHTHRPASEERDGVLYLNPGSAGPRRFGRPQTMAKMVITPSAEIGESARVSVEFQVISDS